MASGDRIIDIPDSSMEDEAEISQPSDTAQAMASEDRFPTPAPLENTADWPMEDKERINILKSLPKFSDHRNRIPARLTKNPYIYKVPHRLREVNKRDYEPDVISIGPYHHGKERFEVSESMKLSCFLKIFESDNSVADRIVRTMKSLEAQVRERYEEPSELSSTDFVEMMVYDACFIVQLIRGNFVGYIFKQRSILNEIVNDLLLLENQLPFFVLGELYQIIAPEEDVHQLVRHALSFFNGRSPFHLFDDSVPNKDIKHLLHLVDKFVPDKDMKHLLHLVDDSVSDEHIKHLLHLVDDSVSDERIKHLLHLVHSCHRPSATGMRVQKNCFSQMAAELWDCMHLPLAASEPTSQYKMKSIRNATELDDAGIGFLGASLVKMKKLEQGIETQFDIIFTKYSKLLIPTLRVEDWTERRFRNYIAYEQFEPSGKPSYITNYVEFMDNLINTSKDVHLLRNKEIIESLLGDDESVALMFNRLLDGVRSSRRGFYYAEIFGRVNKHCQKRRNRWKASLKKNYFNSPWSHISFFAATLLLLLTIVQTIFAVLSH